MAITQRTDALRVRYDSHIEQIEHMTGKQVLSWREDYASINQVVVFTDKTQIKLNPYESFDIKNIKYERIPESVCVSCGKDAHVSSWNWKGWCNVTNKKFWEKVRKVYWHRYLKNK